MSNNEFNCCICKNILIEPYFCSNCKTKFCIKCLDKFSIENGNKCPNENCEVDKIFNCVEDDNLKKDLMKLRNIKCIKCNVEFENYELYKNHKCYKCYFCEKKFSDDENLFNHLKDIHYDTIIQHSIVK